MPVSRLLTEGLADDVAGIYAAAEVRLLRLIAKHLAAGVESPRWAEEKLAELQVFRARARRVSAGATAQAIDATMVALRTAYLRGTAAGQGDADDLGIDVDTPPRHAERSVASMMAARRGQLEDMGLVIVRQAADAYRDAVVSAVGGGLTGATTRLQDAQAVLDELGRKGLTGFVDTSGRRWGLTAYAEMATRTTTAQAAVAGHLDRLQDAGIPLVIVSDSPRECELCAPWEGKVLSQGPVSAMMPNAVTGAMERVDVDGTVDEAIGAGLFHPNCTHNLTAYIPGATKRGEATSNAEGYAEKQAQRGMERKVREWRRREALSLTPEAERKAAAKVKEWQGAIKDHTSATGLPRKYNRESLTAAR